MTIDVTIYHNPECGTSRNTLAMIQNTGIEPNVIEYLKNPPSREQLIKSAYYESLHNNASIENYLADQILKSQGTK